MESIERGGAADFRAQYAGTVDNIATVREAIIGFLRPYLAAASLSDMETALGEAVENSVFHGCRDGGAIFVEAHARNAYVEVKILDTGCGFDVDAVMAPNLLDYPTHGFGLMIMRGLVDELSYTDGGRRVGLLKNR